MESKRIQSSCIFGVYTYLIEQGPMGQPTLKQLQNWKRPMSRGDVIQNSHLPAVRRVQLAPSFDADNESVLLYGESVPLVASQVVLDSHDGSGTPEDTGVPGVAYVIINGIGENRDPQVSGPITQTFTQNDNQTNVDLLEFHLKVVF